jgi:hypothetical protein
MSPAQRHRARHQATRLATSATASPAGAGAAAASAAALERARLGVDLRRLHELQSVDRKIELKRELLPSYLPWVRGILAADAPVQDDVLAWITVWAFDIADYDLGLECAAFMLRHKLSLPERLKRTLGTFIAEEIADAAAKARGQAQDFPLDVLKRAEALTIDEDMPDIVSAKLFKEIGIALVKIAEALDPGADGPAGARQAGTVLALEYLRRAYGKSHTAGVKKDIDRLEREIRKMKTEAAAAAMGNGD